MYDFCPETYFILCGTKCAEERDYDFNRKYSCGLPRLPWRESFRDRELSYAAQAVPEFIRKTARENGRIRVIFTGGEPLKLDIGIVSDILERTETALEGRADFIFETNLTEIDRAWLQLMLEHHVRIREPERCVSEKASDGRAGIAGCTLPGDAAYRAMNLNAGRLLRYEPVPELMYADLIPLTRTGCAYAEPCADPHRPASDSALKTAYEELVDYQTANMETARVPLVEDAARTLRGRKSEFCTFSDCLGRFCAVSPDGGIFPCPRAAYRMSEALGNVTDLPGRRDVTSGAAWASLVRAREKMKTACGGCRYEAACRSGCVMNYDGSKDRFCEGYRALFGKVEALRGDERGGKTQAFSILSGCVCHPAEKRAGSEGPYSIGWAKQRGVNPAFSLNLKRKTEIREKREVGATGFAFRETDRLFGSLFLHIGREDRPEDVEEIFDEASDLRFTEVVLFNEELEAYGGRRELIDRFLNSRARTLRFVLFEEDEMKKAPYFSFFDEIRSSDPCGHIAQEREKYSRFWPAFSCGLGFNLTVSADKSTSPCEKMRWMNTGVLRGRGRIGEIMMSDVMAAFRSHDVDTNERCRDCDLRYLCGGPCKGYIPDDRDMDDPDFICDARRAHFAALLEKETGAFG